MKKLISAFIICVMMLSTVAFASENPVITTSTGREVCLDVPQGKFVDGVYVMPVRRICEIFNATCKWRAEEQMIIIDTPDNVTRLFMYIGSDTLRIFTFTSIITGEAVDVPLEAPLEIVNDRTLVPFEQICRALKGECVWSEDGSSVTVITPEQKAETMAEIYLTAEEKDVAAGEEVELTVMAKNADIIENYGLSGFSAGIVYDKAQFEYVSSTLTDSEGVTVQSVNMENAGFTADSVKTVCLAAAPFDYNNDEVVIGKIVLRALTDEGGEIRLSNRVYTIGYDTSLVYMQKEGDALAAVERGTILDINTNPLIFK